MNHDFFGREAHRLRKKFLEIVRDFVVHPEMHPAIAPDGDHAGVRL
jgi:hypothetical protein